jgi:hypothetical protein
LVGVLDQAQHGVADQVRGRFTAGQKQELEEASRSCETVGPVTQQFVIDSAMKD